MFKIITIAVINLLVCAITFIAVPSALSFDDYITTEPTIQEEEVPPAGGGGMYYEESQDEMEPIGEEEVLEQEGEQESEQPLCEEEQEGEEYQ